MNFRGAFYKTLSIPGKCHDGNVDGRTKTSLIELSPWKDFEVSLKNNVRVGAVKDREFLWEEWATSA